MQIKGEVRTAKVSRKMDDSNRDVTVVDLRVKIPTGMRVPFKELVELAGVNCVIDIEKAQLTIPGIEA